MTEPAHSTARRGFIDMEPVKGTDNGTVRVYQSSAVHSYWPEVGEDKRVTQGESIGPFVWVRVRQQYYPDPATEAAAHLPLEAARELRDQLSWLIERLER